MQVRGGERRERQWLGARFSLAGNLYLLWCGAWWGPQLCLNDQFWQGGAWVLADIPKQFKKKTANITVNNHQKKVMARVCVLKHMWHLTLPEGGSYWSVGLCSPPVPQLTRHNNLRTLQLGRVKEFQGDGDPQRFGRWHLRMVGSKKDAQWWLTLDDN